MNKELFKEYQWLLVSKGMCSFRLRKLNETLERWYRNKR